MMRAWTDSDFPLRVNGIDAGRRAANEALANAAVHDLIEAGCVRGESPASIDDLAISEHCSEAGICPTAGEFRPFIHGDTSRWQAVTK